MRCGTRNYRQKYDLLSLFQVNFLFNPELEHLRMRRLLEGGVYKRKYGIPLMRTDT